MQTDFVLKKALFFKKTIIALLAVIALLISVSPFIAMIVQIKTSQSTQVLPLEEIYWNAGWLIPLCLSVLVIFKIKAMQTAKKWFKVITLLISGVSILVSCLWALLFLIILPQLPVP